MTRPPAPKTAMANWLLICSAAVLVMIVLGGLTRLTESGLSMVEWRPVTGWLPPLDHKEWERVFAAYRETPEFRQLNFWMTLEDFRRIFWLEYLHRLLGRIIGLLYLIPLAWFSLRFRLPPGLITRLVGLLLLGAGQGVLGWYMVKSGLIDQPSVSHYRLAAHLGLAVVIYGALLLTALNLRDGWSPKPAWPPREVLAIMGLILVTMLWGAFLAGIDGGAVYNTFPLMNGRLVPSEIADLSPLWRNPFENVAAVQFLHRLLGTATVLAVCLWWIRNRSRLAAWAALMALAQFGLGAVVVLAGASVPVAVLHQTGAMILLSLMILAIRTPIRQSGGNQGGGDAA